MYFLFFICQTGLPLWIPKCRRVFLHLKAHAFRFLKITIKRSQAHRTAAATIVDRSRQAHLVPAELSSLPAKKDARPTNLNFVDCDSDCLDNNMWT